MSTALAGAVELLERSLTYTRPGLALVTPERLAAPTPCADWDLAALLRHMDDALDAFTEAATGAVSLTPVPAGATAAVPIQVKACALLGWWCQNPPPDVWVGEVPLASGVLVGAAALEITGHGWDVHRAVGSGLPMPEGLAEALLPVAEGTVTDADRPDRFGPARRVPDDAPASVRLLAHLGRG